MKTNSSISDNVMRRVHRMYVLRTHTLSLLSSVVVVVIALLGIGKQVWVAMVFRNMPPIENLPAISSFFTQAFLHTEGKVQLLVLVFATAALVCLRSGVRLISVYVPRLPYSA